MPSSRAFFSETITAAAAPSPIGEHIGRVSGSAIIGSASTSSTESSFWNWALGFRLPFLAFLAATIANWRAVVPYRFMCARAAAA
jgi:hypothetical protein